MKILLYTPTVPVEAGGVQAVFNRLALGLHDLGHEVKRVWPIPYYKSPEPYLDDYFPHLDEWPGVRSIGSAKETLRLFRRLIGGLRRNRPDVVNVHFVRPGVRYFLWLRRWFGFKLVLTFHGSDALWPAENEAPYLTRLVAQADAVTAVSPMVAERLRELVGEANTPVHVIPNGIDYPFWSKADTQADRDLQRPVILAVGRLVPVKNHQLLIEAMAGIRQRCPAARLVILGSGECEADLRQQIASHDLEDVVEMPGEADPETVREWLGRASVYVLPSRSEGMPLSLLEAMAAGVPSVATEVGGVPILAEGGAARLVPDNDPEAMASQIEILMKESSSRDEVTAQGRLRARQYTLESMVGAYEEVLSGVLGNLATKGASDAI